MTLSGFLIVWRAVLYAAATASYIVARKRLKAQRKNDRIPILDRAMAGVVIIGTFTEILILSSQSM